MKIDSSKIFERVLERIRPQKPEIEKARDVADRFLKKIKELGYEGILVGSVARGTFVSGDKDLDIFIFFDPKISRANLEKKGLEIGKKVLEGYKIKVNYAEHPYTKAKVDGFVVEIVPCYRISLGDKILSAVDRSPLHNEYLLKNLNDKQKEDVILLKQFLKAFGCYGANISVRGFSGYLCELLILQYKDLDKLLKAAAHDWNKKIIIDIEGKGKNYDQYVEPLVVIDPVDSKRNVSAAVDRTVLSKFILRARDYVVKPSHSFFELKEKKLDLKNLIKGRHMISVSFAYPKDVVEEIVWSQLERLARVIKTQLYENDFFVYKSAYWTDEKKKCSLVFELLSPELNEYTIQKGPEIWDKDNTKAFMEKHPDYWVKRSRVFAWKKREFKRAEHLISVLLKVGILVPSHIQKNARKSSIRSKDKVLKNPEVLVRYFEW
jgi:tRNA nucleotidyltransferase (CCA-adding enzyme)